ncbi:uncharacterized protein LOC109826213 isoform X2 [Asparagus officinalis]|uniref:uncharacterized protein LOC109826213 isoform X2 n=1 Tax=Asparagus officinalis TaxID=4686 RepID=UPI00098E644B|nr:uncharacterized protein LOC109826213 isoform X2 [Asparagus officinalis]
MHAADDAKTSEFKTFKRLLGETDSKCNVNCISKQVKKLKTFEGNESLQEKNEAVTFISDAKRSSPCLRSSKKLESVDNGKYKHNTTSFMSPTQEAKSDCWKSSFSPAKLSLDLDPNHEYEGIFTRKRKKLLQLVAKASAHKEDKILSKKSDLIPGFWKRLGSRRKSSNLDESPEREKKLPSGKYHLHAPLEAYCDNREQETAREDIQRILRRKSEMALLAPRCSVSNKLITLPESNDKYLEFPTCHGLEVGSEHPRLQWISVSDEKRKSQLDEKIWYQKTCNTLPKCEELMGLPQCYPLIHTFPTSNVLDSSLDGAQWHPNPVLDDEGILDNLSVSERFHAMDLKMIPGTVIKEEGIFENRSLYSEYHGMGLPLSKDNESFAFPSDNLQYIPARHSVQTGHQGKNEHSISEENMLPEFDYWIANDFPNRRQVKYKSIVPYDDSASSYDLGARDFFSEFAKDKYNPPLVQWSNNIKPEHQKRLDNLPLALYNAPNLVDRTEGPRAINVSEGEIISLHENCPISTPRSSMKQEWNSLPSDLDWWPFYTKFPLEGKQADGGLDCLASRSRYEGFEGIGNLMDIQSHFLTDFSSLGAKFSMDKEKSIFSLLPKRLSWHCPEDGYPMNG